MAGRFTVREVLADCHRSPHLDAAGLSRLAKRAYQEMRRISVPLELSCESRGFLVAQVVESTRGANKYGSDFAESTQKYAFERLF